jgi:hypothetical protein
MEQTEETHSPQNTTITKLREHRQNQAPVINPYKQKIEMLCTTGDTSKIEIELKLKLKSIKSKFKRNVAETNWHNRALIKEFSTAGPHRLHKIIGTTSTKEVDMVTTDRSTWYKHKMSIEGGEWNEVRWMMITKKRCIVQQGSGYIKITSERSKRELRKHMEVMEHIKALGGLKKSVSNEVITYQTNTSEFPPPSGYREDSGRT